MTVSRISCKIDFKPLMHTLSSCTGFVNVFCIFIWDHLSVLWFWIGHFFLRCQHLKNSMGYGIDSFDNFYLSQLTLLGLFPMQHDAIGRQFSAFRGRMVKKEVSLVNGFFCIFSGKRVKEARVSRQQYIGTLFSKYWKNKWFVKALLLKLKSIGKAW